jgi:hypothetical protein
MATDMPKLAAIAESDGDTNQLSAAETKPASPSINTSFRYILISDSEDISIIRPPILYN